MTNKDNNITDEPGIKYGLKNNLFYLLMTTATFIKGTYLEQ
jgi:hypothetical protein